MATMATGSLKNGVASALVALDAAAGRVRDNVETSEVWPAILDTARWANYYRLVAQNSVSQYAHQVADVFVAAGEVPLAYEPLEGYVAIDAGGDGDCAFDTIAFHLAHREYLRSNSTGSPVYNATRSALLRALVTAHGSAESLQGGFVPFELMCSTASRFQMNLYMHFALAVGSTPSFSMRCSDLNMSDIGFYTARVEMLIGSLAGHVRPLVADVDLPALTQSFRACGSVGAFEAGRCCDPALPWTNLPCLAGSPPPRDETRRRAITAGRGGLELGFVGMSGAGRRFDKISHQSPTSIMSHAATVRNKIAQLGVTPQGREFLMKAFYPPGPETNVSIPDQTWDATFRFSAAPSTVVTAPPGVTGAWDMLVVNTPGDARSAIIVTGPAGMDFAAGLQPADAQVQVQYITPNTARIVRTYGVMEDNSVVAERESYANPADVAAFRTVGRGVTIHCTASDLYNGGTVTAGQFCAPPKPTHTLMSSLSEANFTSAAAVLSRTFFDIGLDENALIQMCPGAQTTEAKHGVFMPLRLLGPSQEFARPAIAADQKVVINEPGGPLVLMAVTEAWSNGGSLALSDRTMPTSMAVFNNPQGSYTNGDGQPWWIAACVENINSEPVYDTAYDRCATGVSIFRGLNLEASYTVQTYVSLESVVNSDSVFRSITSPGAPFDSRALRAYYDIANSMPFCYPASYNELGFLLPYITEALSVLGPAAVSEGYKIGKAAIGYVGGKVRSMFVTPSQHNPTPSMRAEIKAPPRPARPLSAVTKTITVSRRDGELALARQVVAGMHRSASRESRGRAQSRPLSKAKTVRVRSASSAGASRKNWKAPHTKRQRRR